MITRDYISRRRHAASDAAVTLMLPFSVRYCCRAGCRHAFVDAGAMPGKAGCYAARLSPAA